MDSTNKNIWLFAALALVVGLGLGYWFGGSRAYTSGYDQGYQKAVGDAQATQQAAGARAAQEAAAAANPFQAANPLEGVTANPFERAKQILNPFE